MTDQETCKTAILSDDYRDFIVNDNSSLISRINEEDFCTQTAETNYRCIYVPNEQADPLTSEMLYYTAVPKCYTHISTDSLNQAGILPLHSYPTLHLMGKGVLIGFLDSGIDYRRFYKNCRNLGPDHTGRAPAGVVCLRFRIYRTNDQ